MSVGVPFGVLVDESASRRSGPPGASGKHVVVTGPRGLVGWPVGRPWALGLAEALVRAMPGVTVTVAGVGAAGGEPPTGRLRRFAMTPHDGSSETDLSWDLDRIVEGADAVVVLDPTSRAGEVAVLVASVFGVPVVAVDVGAGPTTATSMGLWALPAAVVAFSAALPTHPEAAGVRVMQPWVDHRYFVPGAAQPGHPRVLYLTDRVDEISGTWAAELPEGAMLVVCGRTRTETYAPRIHAPVSAPQLRALLQTAAVALVAPDSDPGMAVVMTLAAQSCAIPVVVQAAQVAAAEVVATNSGGVVIASTDEAALAVADLVAEGRSAGARGRAGVEAGHGCDLAAATLAGVLVAIEEDGSCGSSS